MNLSLNSIEKRIRRLELKLGIVETVEQRFENADRKAFEYAIDTENRKNPPIPKAIILPEKLFLERVDFFKRFIMNTPELVDEFEAYELDVREDMPVEEWKHIRLGQFRVLQEYLGRWRYSVGLGAA